MAPATRLKSNGFERSAVAVGIVRLSVAQKDSIAAGPPSRWLLWCRAAGAVLYVICAAEGLRQFHRIRAKKNTQHEPLWLWEAVFRKGYSVVVNELVSIAHFVDWLLAQLTKPLKVPIRLYVYSSSMSGTEQTPP